MSIIQLGLIFVAVLISIPTLVFFIETAAALSGIRERNASFAGTVPARNETAAVMIPAHNESIGILPTLEDIKPQLTSGDRLVVVADNCSDDTASVAAAAGAEVTARDDLERIGKGYALDWGIRYLAPNPPKNVIFIDADCRIQSDMINGLKAACAALGKPVQACFLMRSPQNGQRDYSVSEFAWIIRNWVRPLGLRSLGGPTQLMGTGIIIPWELLTKIAIASGNLVEDLKLGLDLAVIGAAPRFFPFVVGTSEFPASDAAAETQRQRWVSGSIDTIAKSLWRYLYLAITQRNVDLLVLCLDALVPPLTLLAFLQVGIFVVAAIALLLNASYAPFLIATTNLFVFSFTLLIAWLRFGGDVLPLSAVWKRAPSVASRLWVFLLIMLGKTDKKWIRTSRKSND